MGVVELALALAASCLSACPLTTARSQRFPSQFGLALKWQLRWLNPTTRCFVYTPFWSTPMTPSCMTTRLCMISAAETWTLSAQPGHHRISDQSGAIPSHPLHAFIVRPDHLCR